MKFQRWLLCKLFYLSSGKRGMSKKLIQNVYPTNEMFELQQLLDKSYYTPKAWKVIYNGRVANREEQRSKLHNNDTFYKIDSSKLAAGYQNNLVPTKWNILKNVCQSMQTQTKQFVKPNARSLGLCMMH